MEIATETASLSLSAPQLHRDLPVALGKLRAAGQVLGPVLFTQVRSIGSSSRDGSGPQQSLWPAWNPCLHHSVKL